MGGKLVRVTWKHSEEFSIIGRNCLKMSGLVTRLLGDAEAACATEFVWSWESGSLEILEILTDKFSASAKNRVSNLVVLGIDVELKSLFLAIAANADDIRVIGHELLVISVFSDFS
jgi:hypothetical protein